MLATENTGTCAAIHNAVSTIGVAGGGAGRTESGGVVTAIGAWVWISGGKLVKMFWPHSTGVKNTMVFEPSFTWSNTHSSG